MKAMRTFIFGIICFASVFLVLWSSDSGKNDAFDHGVGGGTSLPAELPEEHDSPSAPQSLNYRAYSVKQGDMDGTIAAEYGFIQS